MSAESTEAQKQGPPAGGLDTAAHFTADCADVEEFIVSYQAFVAGDTLIVPHHPGLTIGGEQRLRITLRSGGQVVLAGRCQAVEVLAAQRLRRANRAIRLRV